MRFNDTFGLRAVAMAGVAAIAISAPAWAQDASRSFNIPAQDLAAALELFGRQGGVEIVFDRRVASGKTSPAVVGSYTPEAALERLVAGSGLTVRRVNASTFMVEAQRPQVEITDAARVEDVVVTGSRIRGAPPSSPVIRITEEDMRNAGQTDLGDVARSLPQNFNGGQNPGIGVGVTGTNEAGAGGTNLNLRGLGPDATLTLLNGRRLPYDAAFQGVDISAIPAAAVRRIEILGDGASALYGSDAVGGVANIILKRDFDGLVTSARYGGATEGGYEQRQFTAVGGRAWSSGGFIATFDASRSTDITADQRDFTSALPGDSTLFPNVEYKSGLLSGHQELGRSLSASIDVLYSDRSTTRATPFTTAANYLANGSYSLGDVESYVIAPSLDFDLPGGWKGTLQATYGEDESVGRILYYTAGAVTLDQTNTFTNTAKVADVSAEGPLLQLPGGSARLAIGAGYRDNNLDYRRDTVGQAPRAFEVGRDSSYVYGEVFLPLVSPTQDLPLVDSLSFTGALRYENYPGMDSLTTPKLGLVYGPTPEFDVKLSWGKSFKAPTLYQQYNVRNAVLFAASTIGGVGYPSTATAIYYYGGNPDLKPEHANTYTASLAWHPTAAPDASLEVGFFHIDYRDRQVVPVASTAGALSNPLYADLVTLDPSDAWINEIIADAATFTNASGAPFNIDNVVAVLDNRLRNATEQTIEGIDASASYRWRFGGDTSLTVNAYATYLDFLQTLFPGLPTTTRSGRIFNPPRVRARLGAVWETRPVVLAAFVSHVGGVKDDRFTPVTEVDGQTTVDFTVRYRLSSDAAPFDGVELSLSVLNAFNSEPDAIRTTSVYATPYDSTNYSAVGRFIGLTISKAW